MQIIKRDKNKGIIRLRVEKKEDLFHLRELINENDNVEGMVFRKMKLDSGKNIVKKGNVKLTVDHTSLENERLRIIGEIIEGPDDFPRAHQAINVSENDEITLHKNLNAYENKILKDAINKSKKNILAICFDREKVIYYKLKSKRYEKVHEKKIGTQGKNYDVSQMSDKNFFETVNEPILKDGSLNHERFEGIIYASNSFWKEPWNKNVKQEIKKKSTFVTISSVENSISEILRRSEIKTAFKDVQIKKNYEILQEILKRISKNKKVAYGKEDVKKYVEFGAVEKLIVSTKYMKKNKEEGDFNELIKLFEKVEKTDGEFIIMDSDYETGKNIDNFTGIVAMTRYNLNG
ncbi:MAG: hypothetical protein ACOCRX_01240 [Candidatus Woesearchaeota archaeon]